MTSKLNRRDFLKLSGGAGGLFATAGLFRGPLAKTDAKIVDERPRWVKETTTICPYDASGCGFICYTDASGNLINLEGDPDHPINRGGGCAKGSSIIQLHNGNVPASGELAGPNPRRLSKVLYRAPGGSQWEEKTWDWALDQIAAKVKATRDSSFVTKNAGGYTVNRTEAIAAIGGAALDNEECYLLVKMLRALGLVYIEHQARL